MNLFICLFIYLFAGLRNTWGHQTSADITYSLRYAGSTGFACSCGVDVDVCMQSSGCDTAWCSLLLQQDDLHLFFLTSCLFCRKSLAAVIGGFCLLWFERAADLAVSLSLPCTSFQIYMIVDYYVCPALCLILFLPPSLVCMRWCFPESQPR